MSRRQLDQALGVLVGAAEFTRQRLERSGADPRSLGMLSKALAYVDHEALKGWEQALAAQGVDLDLAMGETEKAYAPSRSRTRSKSGSSNLDDPGTLISDDSPTTDNK